MARRAPAVAPTAAVRASGCTIRRTALAFGAISTLATLALGFWLPQGRGLGEHTLEARRPAAEAAAAKVLASKDQPTAPSASPRRAMPDGAPAHWSRWLAACSRRARCSVLQHGVGTESERTFAAFPSVAFFVFVEGPSASAYATRLHAKNLTHVSVLRISLHARARAPMANDVLNPSRRELRALDALQASNEFFDLQLVHTSSARWLQRPTLRDARSLLGMAAATLLLLPDASAAAVWREHLLAADDSIERDADAEQPDAIAAALALGASVAAEGCGRAAVCGAASDGSGGVSLRDPGARSSLLVRLDRMRRLNAHHFSCWHAPRCHHRMYVMDLPAPSAPPMGAPNAEAAESAGWVARVPRLYRVDDGSRVGSHTFANLTAAWEIRGRDLGFATGGMNLDTAIGLRLGAASRAALSAQFLALPVGRDMMLWNIIVGASGLYAIDQEGHVFDDGAIPWGDRLWPYCITVRDCYEKALGALCGRQPPSQPLASCFAAMASELCPDAARPYPCENGCQPDFVDCTRRSKPAAFVGRDLQGYL